MRCPTLVVQGRQDEFGSDNQVTTIAESLRVRCETHLLDRCGHTPHIDQRATVEDIVTQFIRDN